MSGVAKEICPRCNGDCKLAVDLDTAITAKLDDRLMALTDMDCTVTCITCGHVREASIADFDVNLDTGRLEFGTITYN
jgi:hypothetical protein